MGTRAVQISPSLQFSVLSLKDCPSSNEGRPLLERDAIPYKTAIAEAFSLLSQALACSLLSARFDVRLSAHWQHVREQACSRVSPLLHVRCRSA